MTSTIFINDKKHIVDASENLLHACLSIGIDLPYFCWHPELGSLGACRQCAVKVYMNKKDSLGRLVMSCMTSIQNNMIVTTNDQESKNFRKSIIEYLMINHPHDCPVCAEGGSCHLQDMTVMAGHQNRKYNFQKKTYTNQYLGPFISHEMNRCISCYRCVRYYQDYCNGQDLGVFGSGQRMYFGRIESGILENEHSGNLVEICPTGVFTDKLYTKNYSRKWDMQYSPNICHHCSIGCNILPGERYGSIRRIENRYHYDINRYFICDLGRFGYEHTNSKNRIKQSFSIYNKNFNYLKYDQVIKICSKILNKSKKIIGIGSSRASLENNYSLLKLVGKENFSNGMLQLENKSISLFIKLIKNNELYSLSLREIEECDVILIIGEDITQTSSRMALSIRQAVKLKTKKKAEIAGIPIWHSQGIQNFSKNKKNYLFFIGSEQNKLHDITTCNLIESLENQIEIIHCIDCLLNKKKISSNIFNNLITEKIHLIYKTLLNAKKPLIISGIHSGSFQLITMSLQVAKSLRRKNQNAKIAFLPLSTNSIGVNLMGGASLEDTLTNIKKNKIDTVIIMENNLHHWITENKINSTLNHVQNIIVLDHQYTSTVKKANLVIPVANSYESSGTIVNYEGRAQRFFKTYSTQFLDSSLQINESWNWISNIYKTSRNKKSYEISLDNITKNYCSSFPIFKKLTTLLPNSSSKIFGQKIPRSPNRSSGRTSLQSHINIHEPRQPKDKDSMFSFSMEGSSQFNEYSSYIPFVWSPGWNSPQGWNKFQKKIGNELKHGSPGILLFKQKKIQTKCYILNKLKLKENNNAFTIIPYYTLFGSEEISQYSTTIQNRMNNVYALINYNDAKEKKIKEGSKIFFTCLNQKFCILIKISKHLFSKHIALPIGRTGFPYVLLGKKIPDFQEYIK